MMSPSLEKARSLGYEVLFMTEPLDELCAQAIEKFDGKVCMHVDTIHYICSIYYSVYCYSIQSDVLCVFIVT
jgi:Hsp90 protein